MKVGICGCGFVGNAILQFLLKQNNIQTYVYDKFKNKEHFTFEPYQEKSDNKNK